jgi:Ferritin-like domain
MDVNSSGLPADKAGRNEAPKKLLDNEFVTNAISRSAENAGDRRRFLRKAGLAGLGTVAAGAMLTAGAGAASAATTDEDDTKGISDGAILNFALNLEYLEANFYSFAAHGYGISSSLTGGNGHLGGVTGGSAVPFKSRGIQQLAQEIAGDELAHVTFLRSALGSAAVAQPQIDLQQSFTAAAQAAGVVPAGTAFDPFASEEFFLLGAFIFEDVGVTAYKGAAPLISSKTYLEAAAGILSVEAYHAAAVRTRIYDLGLSDLANKISAARGALDDGKDQGVTVNGLENIVPADANGLVYSRTPGEVLNIVYLTPKVATSGGFFPDGLNGILNQSAVGGTVPAVPVGAPETGGGGTAGTQDKGLMIGGGAALAAAAVAGGIAVRNRKAAVDGGPTDGPAAS